MTYEKISAPAVMDFPEEWYDYSRSDHFWLSWRMRVLRRLMTDRSVPTREPLRVLEIGCGRGILRSEIETDTRWTVDGADINEAALGKAGPGRGRTLLYDIHERLPELHGVYDGVVLFDVLEHIEEPGPFLTDASWHLKPGGWILINVPALMPLYSRYDEVVGHFRRYLPGTLRRLLTSQTPELDVVDVRYWGLSLVPIAWFRKILLGRIPPEKIVQTGFMPPTRWMNSVLCWMMLLETSCVHRPPWGTSLMAMARKDRSRATC